MHVDAERPVHESRPGPGARLGVFPRPLLLSVVPRCLPWLPRRASADVVAVRKTRPFATCSPTTRASR